MPAVKTLPRDDRERREIRRSNAQCAEGRAHDFERVFDRCESTWRRGERLARRYPTFLSILQRCRDVRATAEPRFQIAFRNELLEGRRHRVARHAKALGKLPARQQARARRKEPTPDGVAQTTQKPAAKG